MRLWFILATWLQVFESSQYFSIVLVEPILMLLVSPPTQYITPSMTPTPAPNLVWQILMSWPKKLIFMNFNNPEIVAQVFNFLIDKNYKSVKQDKYITVLNFCPTVEVRVQCFVTLHLDTNTWLLPTVLSRAFPTLPHSCVTLGPSCTLFLELQCNLR